MKKNYSKPEAISLNVLCESLIAMSGTDVGNQPVIPTSNKSRGEWGDIWGK